MQLNKSYSFTNGKACFLIINNAKKIYKANKFNCVHRKRINYNYKTRTYSTSKTLSGTDIKTSPQDTNVIYLHYHFANP